MSRTWLLFLLCLSAILALAMPSWAELALRVNESATTVEFSDQKTAVTLAIDNPLPAAIEATIQIELLDPESHVRAKVERVESIARGKHSLSFLLPFDLSKLTAKDRRELVWFRLHYRINAITPGGPGLEGFVSLSEITADLFEIRVAAAGMAHEGMRYRARVQALHPLTRKAAAKVAIEAVLTLETDDAGKGVKIPAAAITNAEGYAVLSFDLPPRFPEFPHQVRPAGGSLKAIARRHGLTVEIEHEVLVDQFPRILITSDKPLYQPGQKLHLRAVVLSPSRRALADQEVIFRIEDPEETKIFRGTVKSSRFGIASIEWPIPENARLGDYWIKVSLGDGDDSGQSVVKVRVSRYDLPNFSVKVQPDHSYYLPGQNAAVKVSADYLFGQPVTRGHVRVVRETEREWNYREQKWDIEEGDVYEGETDSSGVFVAQVKLTEHHEDLGDADYSRFRDITYAAYFTDPTTRRTEQRRFDLRVSREPIHVYVIKEGDAYRESRDLPLRFYVATYYADGTPAQCRVSITDTEEESENDDEVHTPPRILATVRTNRYGLGKVSKLRLPAERDDSDDVELRITAHQSRGKRGSTKEDFNLDENQEELRVETDKPLYRSGEPIQVSLVTNAADLIAIVDVGRNEVVLDSRAVRVRGGRATLTIPYRPEFKDRLTVAAYADFAESRSMVSTRTILYPRNRDLKIEASPRAANYRPGDEAEVSLRVRGAGASARASALGIAITDKAVDERFRTDSEFGNDSYGFYRSIFEMLGYHEQIAGVTFRDLEQLDLSKPVAPDLELLAEVLLNQSRNYYPVFFGGRSYELDSRSVFGDSIKLQLAPANSALSQRFKLTGEYPVNDQSLRMPLSALGINFADLRDPWGTPYRAEFSVSREFDVLTFRTAGADKQFGTEDDFSVDGGRWLYFRRVGGTIDAAVSKYHDRTGGFIRDLAVLRRELANEGVNLDTLTDKWGRPYRIDFDVRNNTYVIRINSGGPNKTLATPGEYFTDDFIVWTSTIDYFAETRARISGALAKQLEAGNKFPQNERELTEALHVAGVSFGDLRDPWERPYYATFTTQPSYAEVVRIEHRGLFGTQPAQQMQITPVTRTAALIHVRSAGADGAIGTSDDFNVATFSGVITIQTGSNQTAVRMVLPIVFSGNGGAITGTVIDPNGAVISAVTITANSSASQTRSTTSNENGEYSLVNLPSGLYDLRFEAPGFAPTVITSVLVRPSSIVEVNVTLHAAGVSETVEVSASGNNFMVDASQSSVAQSVHSTNLRTRGFNIVTKSGGQAPTFTPRLREYFPETLLWQPSLETDERGRAQLKFKLADNITTWKMSVVGSTEDGEIGFVEKEIRAFQPFFVEHDPPKVLTEGDEISLPVVVRNYLDRAQPISLEIKPENWFSLLGPANKRSQVAAGTAVIETFGFRATAPVKEGKQRITVIGAEASDAIEKPVTVHPDGEEKSVTASDIVSGSGTVTLEIPQSVIANSMRAELKIYPNLLAHVAESVEAIMARPYGCGEQTISSTYPSLLYLKHSKRMGAAANAGSSDLSAKATRYLRAGYERLLNYRDESGGFTYWGRGEPDLALTAYALRFLNESREFTMVDDDVIREATAWLIKQQRSDGSWVGYDYGNKIENKRRSALLTAYVARVLAMSARADGISNKPATDTLKSVPPELTRALDYLAARIEEIDEPYLIASFALAALDAGDAGRAEKATAKLRALSHEENGGVYWSLETNTPFYGWGLAGRIETTALAVQALARANGPPENARLMRAGLLFMLKQKDRYGVWYSTQATINVLDSLLVLLTRDEVAAHGVNTAEIFANGRSVKSVDLPPPNQLVSPVLVDLSQFIQAGSNRIEVRRAQASSPASVQAVATYYLPWSESVATQNANWRANGSSGLRLLTKFDKTEGKVSDEITCHVEAERIGFSGYGMLLAEIGLPPGADVDRASLDQAMKGSDWSISQYDILPDRVIVYLWPRAGGTKFDFKFRPRFGLNAQTAASIVYDYYNPEARAIVAPARFVVK